MAFKGYRRSIVLDFDYQQITKGIPQINQQMALLNAEYKRTQEVIKDTGNSFDSLGAKQDYLKNKQQLQAQKVEELKKKVQELSTAEGANEKAVTNATIALKNAETQLAQTERELKDVNDQVKDQNTTLGTTSAKWGDFKDRMNQAGVDVDKVADGMIKVGAAMASLGVISGKMGMDFETAMAKVSTISDDTQLSVKQLGDGVLSLSDKYGKSANDMADGLYMVLSSGIQTKDSLKLLEDATRLAKVGFTDTTTAVDILTSLINGYGMSIDDARKLTDELVISQKMGKFTIGELGNSIGDVIGIASNAGVSFEEVQAAIVALTLQGQHADKSLTGLRQVISAVVDPTAEAAKEAKRLGLQFNAAALESKGLVGFLQDVEKKTRGNSESISQLFGNIRAYNAVASLAGNASGNFAKALDEITNSAGESDIALEKVSGTAQGQLNKALNELKNNFIEAGAAFLPVIEVISKFIEVLASAPPFIIVIISALGGLMLTIGLVVKTMGSVGLAINGVNGILALFNSTTGNATFLTFAKWAAIIIAVTVAITALIVAINYLIGKGNQMNQGMAAITGNISDAQKQINGAGRRANAIGSQNWKGGRTLVGEYGPEVVDLPGGSTIYDNTKSKQMGQVADNSGVENRLDRLIDEMMSLKNEVKAQPREMQRLGRMGYSGA